MEIKLYAVTPKQDITLGGKSYKKGRMIGGIRANTLDEAVALLKKEVVTLIQFVQEYQFGNVVENGVTAQPMYARFLTIVPDHAYFQDLTAQLVKPKVTNYLGYGEFSIFDGDMKTIKATNSNFGSALATPFTSGLLFAQYQKRFFTTGLVYNSFYNGKIVNKWYQVQNATKEMLGWVNKKDIDLVQAWNTYVTNTTNTLIQAPMNVVREGVENVQAVAKEAEDTVSIIKWLGIAAVAYGLYERFAKKK